MNILVFEELISGLPVPIGKHTKMITYLALYSWRGLFLKVRLAITSQTEQNFFSIIGKMLLIHNSEGCF